MLGEELGRCRRAAGVGRYDAPALGPPVISLRHIPKGYAGTRKTARAMQDLIREGAKDFYVRQKAIDILLSRGARPRDYLGEIKALFDWVQQNVRYTKDPVRLEVLHSARRMLELRAGDCDDMSILLGAMLEAVGHPIRLVLTGPDPLRPDLFTHVYLEAYHRDRWIPLDPTMPHPAGWAPCVPVKTVISLERRPSMMAEDMELQGADGIGAVPDWLPGLIRAVRGEAMRPKDPRVKLLWDLLRQRQLLRRSAWLRGVLRRIWERGLPARPHPRTTVRLLLRLRRWGILPRRARRLTRVAATATRPLAPATLRPVGPVAVRPVATVRPVAVRTLRPTAVPAGAVRR
jgi:hypothetical protein